MYAKDNAVSQGQSGYYNRVKNGLFGLLLAGSLATGIDGIVEKAHAQEKQAAAQP